MSVDIHIKDDLYIKSDPLNWILSKRGKFNEKYQEYAWTPLGYFAELHSLFTYLYKRDLRMSECTSIEELFHLSKKLHEESLEFLKNTTFSKVEIKEK